MVEQKYALYDERTSWWNRTETGVRGWRRRYQSRSKFKTPAKGQAYRPETTWYPAARCEERQLQGSSGFDTGSVTPLALR